MDFASLSATGLCTSEDSLDTDAYRRDLWPRDTLRMCLDGTRPPAPAAVVWPENADQVRRALDWAVRHEVPIVPYGAGSGVCGAAAGMTGSLVIDTKRMNRILAIDREARTVHVQTGILGQHLEDRLGAHGWMTAHSPSSIMCSTVTMIKPREKLANARTA